MKRILFNLSVALALGSFGSLPAIAVTPAAAQTAIAVVAAKQSATFAIDNMTCALCPVTVKTAMAGVDGVESVKVDFEAKTATVVFDPSLTTIEVIAAASTNAGYPARLAEQGSRDEG